MLDIQQTRGFQDAWKNRSPRMVGASLDLATFKPARAPRLNRQVTAGEKAKLSRIARRVPEVLVRVGRVTTKTKDGIYRPTTAAGEALRFGNRLTYVTRNDKIALETSDGLTIATKADRLDLAEEWTEDQAVFRALGLASERTRLYRSIILSMPTGTDPVSVQDAARAFANGEFAGHKWLLALHTDTDHPHVHLDVQTVRDDGHKLSPGKDDLERYRESFARHLRDIGIEAEATPRHARGGVPRAPNPDLYHLRKRREQPEAYRWPGRQEEPRADAATRRQVQADPAAARADRSGDMAAQDRRLGVIETYLAAAAVLREGGSNDRQLAGQVEAFVATMPAYAPSIHRMAEKILEGLSQGIEGEIVGAPSTLPHAAQPPVERATAQSDSTSLSHATFMRVYAKPAEAFERWAAMVDENGLATSLDQIRTTPTTLGSFAGWSVFGVETTARREATSAFGDLIMDLRGGVNDPWEDQAAARQGASVSPVPEDGERDRLTAELAELLRQQDELMALQQDSSRRLAELDPYQPAPSIDPAPKLHPEPSQPPQQNRSQEPEPER